MKNPVASSSERQLRILFRLNATHDTGMGHLMRTRALAAVFQDTGNVEVGVVVVANDAAINWLGDQTRLWRVPTEQHATAVLKSAILEWQPHVVVLDLLRQNFPTELEQLMGQQGLIWVAIADDSDARIIATDLVFNDNVNQQEHWYHHIAQTQYFVGPRYFVASPDIAAASLTERPFRLQVRDILIIFGGGDHLNSALIVARSVADLVREHDIRLTFVISALSSHRNSLEAFLSSSQLRFRIFERVESLVPLFDDADFILCTAGNIAYESCALGRPMITLNHVELQDQQARWFADTVGSINLGMVEDVQPSAVVTAVRSALDAQWRSRVAKQGRAVVDGRGAFRVAEQILSHCAQHQ